MPIKLKLRGPPPWLEPAVSTKHPGIRTHRVYEPGDCWYGTEIDGVWFMFADGPVRTTVVDGRIIGVDHRQPVAVADEHHGARPMFVVLPNGVIFCLHQPVSSGTTGWQVSGELPNVTVSPSINMTGPGGWHGWLRNGVLTP